MGLRNGLNFLSEKLVELMAENGMTQKQLADLVGTTQPTISKYIKGFLEPDISMIVKLCFFLKTTPDELLAWDELNTFDETLSATVIEHIINGK